jgi:O-antigen/teichoic acid export membrane protein
MSHSLRSAALSLGAANAIDYGIQFLLPVILTRFLDPEAFGAYRLFWLVTTTALSFATWAMPQSLYFFLPRSDAQHKRLYINQVLLFLVLGGALAALILSPANPLLPGNVQALAQFGWLPPLFVLLWIVSSTLDFLPTADGRALWQAKTIVGLSVLRATLVGLTALWTGSLLAVIWALLAFVLIKQALLLFYVARYHGLGRPLYASGALREQVRHALPFGLAGMLYGFRGQAEQWVAASLFSIGQFAAFSVASVLGPLVALFRQSMNQAFLAKMSKLHAEGELSAMLQLNNRANVALALLLFPALGFAFAFSEALITLVFTAAYAEGGAVMRIYIIALIAASIELNNVMFLLKQGHYMSRINLATLAICILASYLGAQAYGMPGAALGSLAAAYTERVWSLRRIAALLKLPFAQLQDWFQLARILIASSGAAFLFLPLPAISDEAERWRRKIDDSLGLIFKART